MAGGGGPRLVYGDGLEDLKDCFTFGGRIGGGGGGGRGVEEEWRFVGKTNSLLLLGGPGLKIEEMG